MPRLRLVNKLAGEAKQQLEAICHDHADFALRRPAHAGLVSLIHFDKSGFTALPSVPYAWQPVGTARELPSFPSKRLNVMGFMSRGRQAFFHSTEGKVDSAQAAEAFDRFASRYAAHGKPCAVTLDNPPWYTSRAFLDCVDGRDSCGVVVHYPPPYCPELNPIEILWRNIKHDWLPSRHRQEHRFVPLKKSLGSAASQPVRV